tara:strand:+ start:641 stop:850 length:210 start_codon:yes stop_codon:yes gene_type:complete
MPKYKNLNGQEIQLTAQEELQIEEQNKIGLEEFENKKKIKEKEDAKKASAVTKLKALGLTDDEIGALKI